LSVKLRKKAGRSKGRARGVLFNANVLKNTLFQGESQKVRPDIFLATDRIIGYSYRLLSVEVKIRVFSREDGWLPLCGGAAEKTFLRAANGCQEPPHKARNSFSDCRVRADEESL